MVKLSPALALVGLFSAASVAVPTGGADCPSVPAKAVYFLSNADENCVVALKVNNDGTLGDGSVTPTGGKGAAAVDADGNPSGPDPLFSQGAVAVSGGYLAAVNAGSNTLSFFEIDAEDATKLTMLGEPVDTLGDFPNTVALYDKVNQACVVNTGARDGVTCFELSQDGLKSLDESPRAFDLGQTTPPSGPPNTVSDAIFFTDQGTTSLMVFVKGDPNSDDNHGFVATYPLSSGDSYGGGKGSVARDPVKSSPEGTTVLFGSVQVPGTPHLVATDPSVGAGLLTAGPNSTVQSTAITEIEGQSATCWAAYSDVCETVFVTDGGLNRLVGLDSASGEITSDVTLDNGNMAMLDIIASGDYLYALAGGGEQPTVVVLDARGAGTEEGVKHVQNFYPQGVEDSNRIAGIATCD